MSASKNQLLNQSSQLTCSQEKLSTFTRQVGVMVGAGVPIHETFEFLHRDTSNVLCQVVAPNLAKHLTHGRRLSTALGCFPGVFSRSYVVLIQVAEETGGLPSMLRRIADMLERQVQLKRQVSKSLNYPIVVFVVSGVLTLALFNTVIPTILDTIVGLGAELPLPTQILSVGVAVVQEPLSWFAAVATFGGFLAYLRNQEQRDKVLAMLSGFPVIGKILRQSATARYCQTLSLLMSAGVEITRACRVSADASGNPLLKNDGSRVLQELKAGGNLSEALGSSELYPPILADMVSIGEETGRVPQLLEKASEILEDDTYDRLQTFVQLLEPIMLIAIAVGVGFVLISIVMPLLAVTSGL